MPKHPDWIESLYARLANEEDIRVCQSIREEACREVPGNFFRLLLANALTKLGDRISNPKTTLAWILQALGAPAFFTGIIVPLRESGSLVPQILIAGFVRQRPLRKWIWVIGACLQGLAVAGMAGVAFGLDGSTAGWALVGFLLVFSLARGLCSIATKDVMGKTIPKGRRGLLSGWMSSVSGGVATLTGLGFFLFQWVGNDGTGGFVILLLAAAAAWVVAAIVFSRVVEFPGETEGGANALRVAVDQLKLLRDDIDFRRFVLVRALAFGSGLGAPFVIGLAHGSLEGTALWLGIFLAVDGVAGMVSGPILGGWADRSSRGLLRVAMASTTVLLVVVVVFDLTSPSLFAAAVAYPILFFLLGIIHAAVRVSRKTYLIDMAEGNRRTAYVAVSNSVIGVLLLGTGLLTGLLSMISVHFALLFFAGASLFGFMLAGKLPPIQAEG